MIKQWASVSATDGAERASVSGEKLTSVSATDGAERASVSEDDLQQHTSLSAGVKQESKSVPQPHAVVHRVPHGARALTVLRYIVEVESATNLGKTPPMSRRSISQNTDVPFDTVRTVLHRLRRAGLLVVLESQTGLKGAAVYTSSPAARAHLRRHGQDRSAPVPGQVALRHDARIDAGREQGSHHAVSSDKHFAAELEQIITQAQLDEAYRVGANDLLSAWRVSGISRDEFADSVKHIAFYLNTDEAKGIKHHKAWMLQTLRKGYYARPAGFRSREEMLAELRLQEAQERLERLRELDRQQFEADFDLWYLERTEQERQELLKDSFFAKDPGSQAARVALRERFCEVTGRQNPIC